MEKITLIGAGSVVFAKTLIADILQFPALSDSLISLMDIDPGRLATIHTLAVRMAAQLGVKARFEATTDLRAACRGARFVITTIQVGGYKPSTVVDFEIPAKYGVKQTIADTLGVGGVFRALRTIPELVKVARMAQEVGAPNAMMINYSNPMAMNMWGIERMSGIPSVGLCHSVQGTSRQLASDCGLDYKDVSYLVAGVNHMAFFLKFEYKGKDAYPFLFKALDNPNAAGYNRVRYEMMRRLGYFVTESSEHQSEYVPYFIHHGEEVIRQFDIPINEYIRRCEAQIASWGKMERELLDESKPVAIHRSEEYGSTIINSTVTGTPSVIYGNVPNRGLITNLTQGSCVEVPCLVDRQGIQPTHIGELPPQLAAIIQSNIAVQQLTVEAVATNRRDYIYQAVMADPHTATVLTLDKIWAMCDELIAAHQRDGFLGEFAPVMRNTGKPLAAVSRVFLTVEPDGLPFVESSEAAFNLLAENETGEAFSGEVEVEVRGAEAVVKPSAKFQISVPAGGRVELPFTVEKTGAGAKANAAESEPDEGLTIAIRSLSPATLEREFILPKRATLTLKAGQPQPLEVRWTGEQVVSGTVAIVDDATDTTGKVLELALHVNDTDLKAVPPEFFWEGSSIEVAVQQALTNNAPIAALIAVPESGADLGQTVAIRFRNGKAPVANPAITGTLTRDNTGYAATLRLGLAAVELAAAKPILLELAFHVNAFGTAHGKVRAAWQGSENLRTSSARFGLLIPG